MNNTNKENITHVQGPKFGCFYLKLNSLIKASSILLLEEACKEYKWAPVLAPHP